MYRELFDLAGLAMLGWALLIFLPTWRVTRVVAETAVFPVYLCMLYVIGLATFLREHGPGFMAGFGSADGVVGLLASEPVALVAWIHILAFDQVVGVLIYRDNMRHRIVSVPAQSVVLVATLMLGPVGFISYWAMRVARARDARVAWGERMPSPTAPAAERATAPTFRETMPAGGPAAAALALLRRSPAVAGVGVLGLVLGLVSAGVAAANGGWVLGPEGRLLEAVKFDVAVGIYTLTLALILPFAPMTERGRRRWVRWLVGLTLYSYAVENVQAWRGVDPRFSSVAGPLDQAIGGIFFLAALGILTLFAILIRGFFRPRALPDHVPLRLALRYAAGGAAFAFGVGIVMSIVYSGRIVPPAGDMMPLHAAGFHALQALPLVALMLGATAVADSAASRWVHLAGAGWLALCLGLMLQAFAGEPPGAATPWLATSAVGVLAWAAALAYAARARMIPARVPA